MANGVLEDIKKENLNKRMNFFIVIQNMFKGYPIEIGFFDCAFQPLAPTSFTSETAKLIANLSEQKKLNIKKDMNYYYFSKVISSENLPAEDFPDGFFLKEFPSEFYVIGKVEHESVKFEFLFRIIEMMVEMNIRNIQEQGIASGLFRQALQNTIDELKKYNDREIELRTSFQKYIPARVVNEIMSKNKSDLMKGQISEVTILFTDIRGFSSLAEKYSTENVVSMLNDYFSFMIDIVLENGGDIYKFMGDGMMAVFESGKDNAFKALNTALQIKKGLVSFNEKRKKNDQFLINMGIGIHTGKVLIGNIGNEKRSDYTLIGDAVNIASRLENLTIKYNAFLVITDTTYKLIQDRIVARELDSIRLRGRKSPLVIYDVLGYQDEINDTIISALKEYNQGLIQYRIKRWEGAMVHFNKVLSYLNEDEPSNIYLKRCTFYYSNPPSEEWDGVIDSENLGYDF